MRAFVRQGYFFPRPSSSASVPNALTSRSLEYPLPLSVTGQESAAAYSPLSTVLPARDTPAIRIARAVNSRHGSSKEFFELISRRWILLFHFFISSLPNKEKILTKGKLVLKELRAFYLIISFVKKVKLSSLRKAIQESAQVIIYTNCAQCFYFLFSFSRAFLFFADKREANCYKINVHLRSTFFFHPIYYYDGACSSTFTSKGFRNRGAD